ncbi:[FeFe] hydrogenase H-cluster maturation GTPase HydF [Anaerococcus hydrogenalis]|uniref:[FeFe] hydrogenase H-cluster maturation GTPase HydF n=1 Tax=Anaerococcus hydrogenalis TaxID=33029 RepID=A0A2N6ULH0_9FIRM|nr:[FeFe] hydrogenase H-cluster maturation GTPase HydF [Anaerococcus hydrogenalis]MDK7694663.1 [FeFe] hydrogenase H-cluster maturation GTPase HydF [Anaerococcus hydrogenalis]MDK7696441.1 [FeFe] hydrogenase H-cluster maturation GTPase HydF [Anaerococcus hydrogenalis]MDK7707690.1 [FeFe] hydrogenase H-cluster maturation GTPase HydF [Anaerococcus hydrogenalis]PMC82700.1 [FeFe] hydrogenase H-cluster maturation GTPase HydF [Anaerococcus hydrogenalis]
MIAYNSERISLALLGKTNSGKSSFLNFISDQDVSIVSNQKGTTTDPIKKSMEIHDFGPVLFFDTAGFDDDTNLYEKRIEKTKKAIEKADILLYFLSIDDKIEEISVLKEKYDKIIFIATKQDLEIGNDLLEKFKAFSPLAINIKNNDDREKFFDKIKSTYKIEDNSITKSLVKENDLVLLVIPQDAEAPKYRLIKPQVMTIREIIDKNASAVSTNLKNLENTLNSFNKKPDLVITDSQYFKEVYNILDKDIRLTSFSVLFSAFKADINYYIESVKKLDQGAKKILIAEACSHPPISEDIGTVKIPKLLKKRYKDIEIDFQRGEDFENIEKYDLIIQCGACMFNKKYVMERIKQAKEKNIPMTNYGIVIAYLNGILDKISI